MDRAFPICTKRARKVFVRFFDARDTPKAIHKLGELYPEWTSKRLSPRGFLRDLVSEGRRDFIDMQNKLPADLSDHEGCLVVRLSGLEQSMTARGILDICQWLRRDIFGTHGEISAFKITEFTHMMSYVQHEQVVRYLASRARDPNNIWGPPMNPHHEMARWKRDNSFEVFKAELVMEFYNIRSSDLAIKSLNGRIINVSLVFLIMYLHFRPRCCAETLNKQGATWSCLSAITRAKPCRLQATFAFPVFSTDTRSTRRSCSATSPFGRYNFMYLRIDVTNQRNFGYAFINFLDPLDVADFGARMIGRRWCEFLLNLTVYDPKSDHYIPIPGSNALVSTSYATVQGLDHLVQKFKNHCVMFEHPLARPKVMSPFLHVVLAFSNYQVCRYSTPILTRWYRKRPPSPLPMIPLERAPAP